MVQIQDSNLECQILQVLLTFYQNKTKTTVLKGQKCSNVQPSKLFNKGHIWS
jgi:hypothetical protein